MSVKTEELSNWKFRQVGKHADWKESHDRNASTTEIFPDLIAQGIIQDPYKDRNESDVQWVGEADWEYQTVFDVDLEQPHKRQLAFKGLDTFAEVFLNGSSILKTENMWREYIVDLNKDHLSAGSNTLHIVFKSPLGVDRPFEPHSLIDSLDSSRMFVRKAQYHYGWDWGPVLLSSGIFRPVQLLTYKSAYLKDVFVDYNVADTKDGSLQFNIKTELSDKVAGATIKHEILDEGKLLWSSSEVTSEKNHETEDATTKVELWYPHTHGSPKLYTISTQLIIDSSEVDSREKLIGFRKSELIQEAYPDEEGTSFYFKINDLPIYINGTNWIPAHNYVTTLTREDYAKWVEKNRFAQQNLLRIWGGGIYESDYFYEEADKAGVLVWQDFMFACGQYPGDEKFRANIQIEVEQQLKRLRQYSSIIIYAGNNEDYVLVEEQNLASQFFAKPIYEEQLPHAVAKHHPNAEYIIGSPFSPKGLISSDSTVGDVHEWNVWHGKELDYQDWPSIAGRFVSEFGMLAFPNIKTYKENISDKDEFYPQSRTVELHVKAAGFERKLSYYIFKNLRLRGVSLKDWIYYSQLVQSESNHFALNAFRRRWGHDKNRRTGGQIVWQLNDCYPVASWAIMDHYLRPKLGYYRIKRDSSPVIVGVQRSHISERYNDNRRYEGYRISKKSYSLDVWISNISLAETQGVVEITLYDTTNSKVVGTNTISDVSSSANSTVEVVKDFKLPLDGAEGIVALVEFKDSSNKIISSIADWPDPLKYVKFSKDTSVQHEVNDGYVKIWSDYVVKAVEIQLPDIDSVFLHDNGFDLFPGKPVEIIAEGLKSTDVVDIRYYY